MMQMSAKCMPTVFRCSHAAFDDLELMVSPAFCASVNFVNS